MMTSDILNTFQETIPNTLPNQRQILITSALPYANGAIHLGHLVEHVQTDIWSRFQKLRGHECYYVCADDTHGAAIVLEAEKRGITPEAWITQNRKEHLQDFKDFHIGHDIYHSTHSEENKRYAESIYRQLRHHGCIYTKTVRQLFDPIKNMFLPDRFVKGTCPQCGAHEQYGDNCDACSATYSSEELINPRSRISDAVPEWRESEHYFFRLTEHANFLQTWVTSHLPAETANKIQEWIDKGLTDWCISRDAPYFGFEIPDAPGKYFYVWLDAPIGYISSFDALCQQKGIDIQPWLTPDTNTELVHFIGKDILYFHTLFWPAILKNVGYRQPSQVITHGFLTYNGKKLSKSAGTFITARAYLDSGLHPDYLRYYFASKLNGTIEDINLSPDDFADRVNADLIGKYVNIASRCSGFLTKYCNGKLLSSILEHPLLQSLRAFSEEIAQSYEKHMYGKAIRLIREGTDLVNAYIETHKPWILAKNEEQKLLLQEVSSVALYAFYILSVYLKPVIPYTVQRVEEWFGITIQHWDDLHVTLPNTIQPYQHLLTRMDVALLHNIVEHNKV